VSPTIRHVLATVVKGLVDDGELILEVGASTGELIEELLDRLRTQGLFAQLGAFLSAALLASPRVAELYATNEELIERVNAVEL